MKLLISKATVNHFATRMAQLGIVYHREILDQTGENMSGKGLVNDLPFFANIKNHVSKVANITKTTDAVEISINEEFIQDYLNVGFDMYERTAKHIVGLIHSLKSSEKDYQTFVSKWEEDNPVEVNMKVPDTEPTEDAVEVYGWTFVKNPHIKAEGHLNPNDPDDLIEYNAYIATRGIQSVKVWSHNLHEIAFTEKGLLATAKFHGYPVTLVKACRELVGKPALVDEQVSAVVADEVTE